MIDFRLPDIKLFKQHPQNKDFGWTDNYGAIKVAENYCGNPINLNHSYQWFYWSHGCRGPWSLVHPEILTSNLNKKRFKYLVETKEQEIYLKKNGYINAKAVGLPIIYVKEDRIERVPSSLLIMPAHTLQGDQKLDQQAYDAYVEFIKPYLGLFSTVKVCLHYGCMQNNMWVNEFKALGIEIIEGARPDDENALLRQTYLFKQFEFVTTNNWGSHVAYGLLFGCKVSIAGPYTPRPKEDYLKDGTWIRNPATLEIILSDEVKNRQIEALKELYISPELAQPNIELGRQLVGYYDKKTPKELYKIITPSKLQFLKFVMIESTRTHSINFVRKIRIKLKIRTRLKRLFNCQ